MDSDGKITNFFSFSLVRAKEKGEGKYSGTEEGWKRGEGEAKEGRGEGKKMRGKWREGMEWRNKKEEWMREGRIAQREDSDRKRIEGEGRKGRTRKIERRWGEGERGKGD